MYPHLKFHLRVVIGTTTLQSGNKNSKGLMEYYNINSLIPHHLQLSQIKKNLV